MPGVMLAQVTGKPCQGFDLMIHAIDFIE